MHTDEKPCSIAWAELRLIVCKVFYHFDLELQEDSETWIDQRTFALWEKGALNVKLTAAKRAKRDVPEREH